MTTADEVQELVVRAVTEHQKGHADNARRLVHKACAAVEAVADPYVWRGAVLTELVDVYGDGLTVE